MNNETREDLLSYGDLYALNFKLEKENKKLQEKLDKINKILNTTKLQDYAGGNYFSIKEFDFVKDIQKIIKGDSNE